MEEKKPTAVTVYFVSVYIRQTRSWKSSKTFATMDELLNYISKDMAPYLRKNPTTTMQLQTRVEYR